MKEFPLNHFLKSDCHLANIWWKLAWRELAEQALCIIAKKKIAWKISHFSTPEFQIELSSTAKNKQREHKSLSIQANSSRISVVQWSALADLEEGI